MCTTGSNCCQILSIYGIVGLWYLTMVRIIGLMLLCIALQHFKLLQKIAIKGRITL